MYPRTIIDSLPAVPNRDQLTHKDLHAHFSTGQSILLSGSGRDKKYGYRNGIQTDLGDIRNDVWRDLVRELIVRSHEEDLFDKLLEWEKEHTYWLKTKAELEHYTLELYAARIFDNPKWVDYQKKIVESIGKKPHIVTQAGVKQAFASLEKEFKYYRLSLYTFSLSSLMEVMLSGNFKESYISGIRDELQQMSDAYRDLFEESSHYLEKLSNSAVDAMLSFPEVCCDGTKRA